MMRTRLASMKYLLIFTSILITPVYAADEAFTDRLLGNPLLILVSLLIIDIIAFAYRKTRR